LSGLAASPNPQRVPPPDGRGIPDVLWRLVDPVLAVVFPSTCPSCGEPLARPSRGPLCLSCWRTLPRHAEPRCACGLPLGGLRGACGRCRRGLNPVASGASLGPYQGSLRALLHELKYRGRRRVAGRLAAVLLGSADARRLLAPGAVLVPIPLHPRRRRERGFNQSELIAAALARGARLEAASGALVRRRDTAPQTGLSAARRRKNVRGAFAVRKRARIAGRTVVLVDDVVTTGATAQACAQALLSAGASEVRLLTVARVVDPPGRRESL
jgi:ComF family protein